MQVTIVNNSQDETCDAGCGMDWSSAEAITLAGQRIRDQYGDRVQLEYLDLSKPIANQEAFEKWERASQSYDLSLPVLLINGKPRISGPFEIRQLLDSVDAEMDIGAEH